MNISKLPQTSQLAQALRVPNRPAAQPNAPQPGSVARDTVQIQGNQQDPVRSSNQLSPADLERLSDQLAQPNSVNAAKMGIKERAKAGGIGQAAVDAAIANVDARARSAAADAQPPARMQLDVAFEQAMHDLHARAEGMKNPEGLAQAESQLLERYRAAYEG